jgi:hypothetical protein
VKFCNPQWNFFKCTVTSGGGGPCYISLTLLKNVLRLSKKVMERRVVAKLEIWVAKLEGWMAKLERWVVKL